MKILHWIIVIVMVALALVCVGLSIKYNMIDNLRYWEFFAKTWHVSVITIILAIYMRFKGIKYL